MTARAFLRGQLEHFSGHGWDVHLVCGEPGLEEFAAAEHVAGLHLVPARRDPSPQDPATLVGLWRLLRRLRPEVVVAGTPKMGVLGTVAAFLARVPRRVYLVHGYRAEGLSGVARQVMVALERLACAAATDVVAVSPSLRRKLSGERITRAARISVLGAGSANGVDLARFRPTAPAERATARQAHGLPVDARVVCFVGRLTADKGVRALPEVWEEVSAARPDAWLLVVGAADSTDPADLAAVDRLRAHPRVRLLGRVEDVETVYRASDVHAMLTRREGLGMVALEAAACGVPTVALAVTGVTDAIRHERTGTLVSPGSPSEVARGVVRLLDDPGLRERFGAAGIARVRADFAQEQVWASWEHFLDSRPPRGPRIGERS
jgi:glycosyltransferase involved in cell wall biosynthesis